MLLCCAGGPVHNHKLRTLRTSDEREVHREGLPIRGVLSAEDRRRGCSSVDPSEEERGEFILRVGVLIGEERGESILRVMVLIAEERSEASLMILGLYVVSTLSPIFWREGASSIFGLG